MGAFLVGMIGFRGRLRREPLEVLCEATVRAGRLPLAEGSVGAVSAAIWALAAFPAAA